MVFDAAGTDTFTAVADDVSNTIADPNQAQLPGDVRGADRLGAAPADIMMLDDRATQPSSSIVFVDAAVADYLSLVDQIAPGAEVIVLRSDDGLAAIAAHLSGRSEISSIHILSHGREGQLDLGGQSLTGATLLAERDTLTAIGQALAAGGDILIYGCDVGRGVEGQAFVDALAVSTGRDVAASTDATGADRLGGNWILERTTGTVETQSLSAPAYDHLLALVATDDVNSVSASSVTAVTGFLLTNDTGTLPRTITEVHGRSTSVGAVYTTAYGSIQINADGSYSYNVDTNNATVRGLTAGQTITDIISYSARDAASATPDFGYLTITINGVSNPPDANDNFASVIPVSSPAATGNLVLDAGGGAPPDSIDLPQSIFRWEDLYTSGAGVAGSSRTVDGITVAVSTTNISAGTFSATVSTATQGGHTGYLAQTIDPSTLSYTAPTTTFAFSQPVVNLSFGFLDVDNGGTFWQDRLTVTATRNGVPVTFQAQYSGWVTRSGDSFYGNNAGVNNTDANGNVVLVFDGAVDNVVIRYDDGPGTTNSNPGSHLIGISDLSWQNTNSASVTQIGGVAVTPGGTTIAATYGSITVFPNGTYTYTVDANNALVRALPAGATLVDTIPYQLTDLLGQSDSADLRVTITGINDAPAGTNNTVTIDEDATYTFNAASFGFSDPIDQPGQTLQSVLITTLPAPSDGLLYLNGTAVTAGQDIAVGQLGQLTFVPATNRNGNGVGAFTFQVRDTGGTANGGVDLDPTPNTFNFNIRPINDAPVTTVPVAQTVAEDAQLIFSAGTGNAITFADADSGPSGLETVTLSVSNGTLTLGSTAGLTGLSGNGSGSVTFTGTVAQITAAVSGLRYQGSLNFNGSDTLTVSVTDDGRDLGAVTTNGTLSAIVRTVPITVSAVNDPPLAVNDAIGATEDVPLTIAAATLLANDTDAEGNTLTITSVQSPVNGTVTLVGGNPVFTPTPNYFGPASFTYTISDGNGGTSTATVNLTIAPVNDAPVAANDAYTTSEDATLNVTAAAGLLLNDSDVDTSSANLNIVTINGVALAPGAPVALASGAILTPNANGTFSYNPNGAFDVLAAGQTSTDSFTYQVSDGQGGFATATAVVTITGVNDGPVAMFDTNSTVPRVPVAVAAGNGVLTNDTDVDTPHASLVVSAVGGVPASVGQAVPGSNGGMFVINADGSYSFDPGTDFDSLLPGSSAISSISYTVSDGQGGTATTTLTVSLPYQNLPPFVQTPPAPQTSSDGSTVSIPLAAIFSDPNPTDVSQLVITASGLPPGLSVDATGTIVGTLAADASQHAGPYLVTITATDPSGSQISTTFNFTVTNPPPVAANDTNSVTEHGSTTGRVTANDTDGGSDSDQLSVTAINGAPYTPGNVLVLASGAQLIMAADGSYSYDPNNAFDGMALGQTATDSFTYQVSDGQGGFASATATITIVGQNDAPEIVDPNNPGVPPANPNAIVPAQTGVDGTAITPLNVSGYFTDPDTTDTLTLAVVGTLPAGVTFNPGTGTFSGTPASTASQGGPANNGVYTVLVTASDGHGGVASTAVTFTIANPAPVAVNDNAVVNEHATVAGNLITNDDDGGNDTDVLTVATINGQTLVPGSTITLPSGALLTMQANGNYTYNPNGSFASLQIAETATDTFTYTISDGQGGTATAIATLTVRGQNDAPVALADANSTAPRIAISVNTANGVLNNDSDVEADPIVVTSIGNGSTSVSAGTPIAGTDGGTFVINADGSYTFDPGNDFDSLPPGVLATTSVTYTISDGQGGTSTTTLTVTLPYANLPPMVQQPIATQVSVDGATIVIPVANVFSDPNPGDVLTVTAAGLPPGLNYNPATGAIEGTLTANASQNNGMPYTVTLTAVDPFGSSVTSTFTFTVGNPAPVAINDTNTVTEHGTTLGSVVSNDHDGLNDTDLLSVTAVNGAPFTPGAAIVLPSGATLTIQSDGTYGYATNGAFDGLAVGQTATDSFSYRISDGQGGVATATVTLTITGQNEVPVVVDPTTPGIPPIDPSRVVPVHVGQDGSAIAPLNVMPYFRDADTADTLLLSVDAASMPAGVTFNPSTGTFSGTPTAAASQGGNAGPGLYDVVVTANDGHGGTTTTTVRFAIANPAPVAIADTNMVAEHSTITGAVSVLSNDTDGNSDTDPLTVTAVNGTPLGGGAPVVLPSGALLTMRADGTYDYSPNGAFGHLQVGDSVTDSFAYQISDGQGGYATAVVSIVITGENDAPQAYVDTNFVSAGGQIGVTAPLGVLANDTDPESDPLVVTAVTAGGVTVLPGQPIAGNAGGTFVIYPNGSYTFDTGTAFDNLPAGTTASTSVTYTISDGMGGTSTTTLSISVPYANLPPVLNAPVSPQTAVDGDAIAINVSSVFRDPNPGDVLTLVASGLPDGLSLVNGQIVGTIASDASVNGPYTVTLTGTDIAGHQISSTFTFAVANAPPIAINDLNTVGEHGSIAGSTVVGNDRDGRSDTDPLVVTTINGAPLPVGGTVVLPSGAELVMQPDGTYSYDPQGVFNGLAVGETASDSFTYVISDGQGGTATATVAITVVGANDAPVVINPLAPGQPVSPLTQVVPTQTGADGAAVTPLTITSYFGDPDRTDQLVFSVNPAQLPSGMTFDPASGTFAGSFDPSASLGGPTGNGLYPIVVTASDGHGGTVSTIVVFSVGNPAPVAADDVNTVMEHGTTTGAVLPNDRDGGQDGDPLTVTAVNGQPLVLGQAVTLPSGAVLVMAADGTYTYDPNRAFDGLSPGTTATDTFTYQISDQQGGFDTATVTLTIQGENDGPTVIDPITGLPPANPMTIVPVQTGNDGSPVPPLSVRDYFTDPDVGDVLTLSAPPALLPPGVSFNPVTGTFTGVPTADASTRGPNGNGVYVVPVTATDASGATVTTLVTFVISNPPPVAMDDTSLASESTPTTGTVLGNDRDGGTDTDTLVITGINGQPLVPGATISLPSGALLIVQADGSYSYDPNGQFESLSAGATAADSFTYTISDGQGGVATATVTITVVGENDAPVIVDPNTGLPPADPNHIVPPTRGADGQPISPVSVAAFVTDPDATDVLTYVVDPASLPPGLTFDPATGTFTGVPTANASVGGPNGDGTYTVVVTIHDGQGGSTTTTVTFTFVNTPPMATDDMASTAPGDRVVIPVLGNDRDGGLDGDALTVISAVASSGTVTIEPNGALAYQPDPGFVGLAEIVYTISDGQGGTATAIARVLVVPNAPLSPSPSLLATPTLTVPGSLGIAVPGAVLAAVHGVEPLNSLPPTNSGLAAEGVVVSATNGISPLGSSSGALGDVKTLHPVWRLQAMIDRDFNGRSDPWQPEGLTGFSLRYTFATDADYGQKAQIVLDSMVRDRTLIVNLSSTELANHAKVVSYSVKQSDGAPLPQWLDRAGPQVLIGERPVDVETVRLRVTALLSDGSTIERDVEIQTMSGEIKPYHVKDARVVPLFGDQLTQARQQEATDTDLLLRALRR